MGKFTHKKNYNTHIPQLQTMKAVAFYLAFATTKSLPVTLPPSFDFQTEIFDPLSVPASTIPNQLSTNTENLKILDRHNFDRKVLENDHQDWIIMFYLPTCERSKLLAPKFQEAAHLAREFGVKFGVVDAWNEYLLLDEHNIELDGYPTIKYFDYETKEFRDYPEKLHGYYTSSQG